MAILKPYHRNWRAMKSGANAGYSGWAYIVDREYAKAPEHYVRAFTLIENDLRKLFEYIEPSDESLKAYSYRIHELLMRTCIEIEANFKAILNENIFQPRFDRFDNPVYNISVYKKVDFTHHLSSYNTKLTIWNGAQRVFHPFEAWSKDGSLPWYQAYNKSKHDRQDSFKLANMEHLLDAVAGLLILLSSQFTDHSFSGGSMGLAYEGDEYYDWESSLSNFFRIKYPNDWSDDEIYDFNWSLLKKESDRFQKFDYNSI